MDFRLRFEFAASILSSQVPYSPYNLESFESFKPTEKRIMYSSLSVLSHNVSYKSTLIQIEFL